VVCVLLMLSGGSSQGAESHLRYVFWHGIGNALTHLHGPYKRGEWGAKQDKEKMREQYKLRLGERGDLGCVHPFVWSKTL
jgi:hypothetical protein